MCTVLEICFTMSAIRRALPRLVALDVPGVFDHARGVEQHPHAPPVGRRPHFLEVRQAEGVHPVGERLEVDERDLLFGQRGAERGQVHVAGEHRLRESRTSTRRIWWAAKTLPGWRVARHGPARRNERRQDQLHAAQEVVRGADVRLPEDLVHRGRQRLEVPRPRVGLVAEALPRAAPGSARSSRWRACRRSRGPGRGGRR